MATNEARRKTTQMVMDFENFDLRREAKTFKVVVDLCEGGKSFPCDTDMAK